MKKHFLSITLLLAVCTLQAQTLYFQDNFDSYTAGDYLCTQNNTDWTTWNNQTGGATDALISNASSFSNPNALHITGESDIVYRFANFTTGKFRIEMRFFIPPESLGAYFNCQHYFAPGIQHAFEVYFNSTGLGVLTAGDADKPFTIPVNTWFNIQIDVNLDDDLCTLLIDGTEIRTWQFSYQTHTPTGGVNQLGGIDFYSTYLGGTGGDGNYFVDNFTVWENEAGEPAKFVINPEAPIELNVNFTGEKTINLSNQGGNSLDYEIIPVYIIPEINHTSTGLQEITYCTTQGIIGVVEGNTEHYIYATGYSPEMLQGHIGKTVKQFDFGIKGIEGILSAKLCIWDMGIMGMPSQNDPIYEQTIEVSSLIDGKNSVTLNEPWLIDGRYLYIGFEMDVIEGVVGVTLDDTPVADCSYLGRLLQSHGTWKLLPETFSNGDPCNGFWDMKIYVDGTPITPWMDLNHTSGKLQADFDKDLKITFGADDIVEKCEKKAKLYFHSTDFYKEETILDVTVNFLVGIDELTVSDIKVYPNPTTGELRVTSYELPVTGIEIFDIYGRNLTPHTSYLSPHTSFDISHLPAGVYFLRIDGKSYKVIKN